MIRKDLYSKMYEAVLNKADIQEPLLTNINNDLSIYKFSDVFSQLEPELAGEKSYLKGFTKGIKNYSINPDFDLEEEISNPFNLVSFETIEPSRKIHLHELYSCMSDVVVVVARNLYQDKSKDFSDAVLWKAIERLWVNINANKLSAEDFFNALKNKDDSHYYILKTNAITTDDCWRIYSEAYFEQAVNKEISMPEELAYTDSPLCIGRISDWSNSYEQYHDSFNIIADMRRANDLLTRFLKMYQVLEFFTFRYKLIPLAKGQATRNSFISNVRHTVENIAKGELKSLQGLFANIFKDIYKTEVKDLIEPPQSHSIKLYRYINSYLTLAISSMPGINFTNISSDNQVAELIYKIRCCIVHSKESEMHFTPNNISEYKDLIPVMKVLIKVMQKEIVEMINDSHKNELEFANESMLLY